MTFTFVWHHYINLFSGELGWELFVKRDEMAKLYDAILEAGKEHKMVKFGKFALDIMRQEKGMRGWGGEVLRLIFVTGYYFYS